MLVIGGATKRTTLGELRCQLWSSRVLVGVRNVRVGLIDHRLQLRVISLVRVCPNLRRRAHIRVCTGIDAVLAAQDPLKGLLLGLLVSQGAEGAGLPKLERLVLVRSGGCVQLTAVGLIWQSVYGVSLVDEILIVIAQPIRQLCDCRGRRVLWLATATHGYHLVAKWFLCLVMGRA